MIEYFSPIYILIILLNILSLLLWYLSFYHYVYKRPKNSIEGLLRYTMNISDKMKTKSERREQKRKPKMPVHGKSVFILQDLDNPISYKKKSKKKGNKRVPKRSS